MIAAEFIINDIAGTLETLTIQDTSVWMPKIKMSKSDDEDTMIIENRQYELQCKALLDEAIKSTDKYSQSLYKAYAYYGKNTAVQCKIKLPDDMTLRENFQ